MYHRLTHAIPLTQMQRVKKWHVAHRAQQPLEYHAWDAVLTVWLVGWGGWVPALVLDAWWALPLCAVAVVAPRLYVDGRRQAHGQQRLRCDWLHCFD